MEKIEDTNMNDTFVNTSVQRGISSENVEFPFPSPMPTWEIAIKVLFYVLTFLLDIVGNTIVILIVVLNRKMHVTTNVLIVNLAVSDLMVGIFCIWVHLGRNISFYFPINDYVCKNTFIQVTSVTSSVLTLTVISVERFMAIVFPLKKRWSPRKTSIIIIITWCLSAIVASPHLAVQEVRQIQWLNYLEVFCSEAWYTFRDPVSGRPWSPSRAAYYIVSVSIMYIGPVLIMIVAYTIVVYKLVFRKTPGAKVGSTAITQERAKRKVIKMLVIVMAVFTICWTPQQVMLLVDIYPLKTTRPAFLIQLKYAAVYIAYSNSALNPILYGGFNENFRKGFMEAFRCLLIKRVNRIGPDSVIPSTNRSLPSRTIDYNPVEGHGKTQGSSLVLKTTAVYNIEAEFYPHKATPSGSNQYLHP